MKNKETVDIKKQIIAEKDNHLKELIADVQRLIVLLKKGIPYKVLSDVLSYFKMTSLNMDTELDASNENVEAKFTLEFVQCLLTTIPKDDFENNHLEEKEFNEIIECASKIFSLRLRYLMAINFENSDNLSPEYTDYIFTDFLRMGITGKRYDIFEVEHHRKILNPLSGFFKQCYGFDIEEVYDGLAKLKEEFTFGMSKTAEELNKFMDGKDINNLTEEEQMKGQSIFGKFLGLELHNVSSITNWSENFIRAFAYELGENSSFVNNVNFENIINLHFDINKKPVINIEGNYYCPMIHRLLDNFDKILIKDICKKLPSDAESIRSILANTSEITVGEMFKDILPESDIYYKNYYKENSKFIENDILIEYDNSLIVIEVKSGSFTPDLAINNINSHLSALNKLIEEADSQSNRLVNLLKTNGHLDIYEDNKKRSPIKKTLKYSDYNYIFKFAITLDGFNEIEARAEKIGFLNLNDDVIVLSIDDLRVYSDYFEKAPSLFFHYLMQRVLATRCKGINPNDELDHLGLYIAHNTYTYWADAMAKEYKTDHILWTGYREDIDKYYNHKYLKIKQVDKPIQNIPNRIQEIISYCEKNRTPNHLQLTSSLLDLEKDKQRKEVDDGINMMINFFEQKNRPKYAYFKGVSNMFISCIYNNLHYDTKSLYMDAYANMKVSCVDEITVALLYYDSNKKLNKISCEILKIDAMPYSNEELDERVNSIKDNRINAAKITGKIGRNEPCPCGSGKKYKKCCLK